MRELFADTFYWIALANPGDDWHDKAKEVSRSRHPFLIITTDEVLVEFLNWFHDKGAPLRKAAAQRVHEVWAHPNIKVLPQTRDSFRSGLSLYEGRPDKEYSMTDCVSMGVMRGNKLMEVLTHDYHFVQEGFTILLTD